MRELTLEHLAPYLPYGLKMKLLNFPIGDGIRTLELDCGHDFNFYLSNNYVRPILRTLSDLDKEIPWNFSGKDFGMPIKFSDKGFFRANILKPYTFDNITNGHFDMKGQLKFFTYLFAHHFDVFGLIEAGLGIDINTISHA